MGGDHHGKGEDPYQNKKTPYELGTPGGITWRSYVYKEEYPEYLNEYPRHDPARYKDMTGKILPPGIRIPRADKSDHLLTTDPVLVDVQNRLKAKGLKDPWLRNEAWRYDPKVVGTKRNRYAMLARSIKYGVAAFLITLAIEKTFSGGHHHHGEVGAQYKLLKELEINQ